MNTSQFIRENAQTLAIIATIIGATWMLSEKINDVRVELHKEIAEVNENLSEDISDFRAESHEDTGYLRADVRGIDTKMDGFIDSHRREHDILYGSAKKDEEDSTSAN